MGLSFADIIARSMTLAIDESQRWPVKGKDGDKSLPQSVGLVLLTLLVIARCSVRVEPSCLRRSQKSHQVVIFDRRRLKTHALQA